MSQRNQQSSIGIGGNVFSLDASEAQTILADLRFLRRKIIDAWQERAVVLTREEQEELRKEIQHTCALLADLTSSRS